MSLSQALPPAERDLRRPGCTDACQMVKAIVPGRFGRSELLLHDPEAHEEYGQSIAGPFGGQAYIQTGALVVALIDCSVTVGGRLVNVSPTEWRILRLLAVNLGWVVSSHDLMTIVWGPEYVTDTHLIRVNVARLREKLGGCARLIKTKCGIGYQLFHEPPSESADDVAPVRRRWAVEWDACRRCGGTDLPHHGHGFCRGCKRSTEATTVLGQWAPKLGLEACRDCRQSSTPHRAHGLCHRCFSRRQREALRS